jgi:N-acetylglucosamine-6-phosphate deacetylase
MLLTAPTVLTADAASEALSPGFVVTENGTITDVGQGAPPRLADVALPDGILAPGFVDLQVNGYYGVEFQDADAASWSSVARRLPETGTTAFLPTMITAPLDELAAGLRGAAVFVPGLTDGARVLGVHVEGPFIAKTRRGAHNPAWITDPSPAAIAELLAAGAGVVRLVTLAAELPGAVAAIEQLSAAGVLVSVGHTDAVASQVAAAATAGARKVTHLFNAQRPLGHR